MEQTNAAKYEVIGWRNLWLPQTSTWHLSWGEDRPCIVGDWEPIYRKVTQDQPIKEKK